MFRFWSESMKGLDLGIIGGHYQYGVLRGGM